MKISTLIIAIPFAVMLSGCDTKPVSVTETWEAKIYRISNCDHYEKGDLLRWDVTYLTNGTFRTIYSNGADGISNTKDDKVSRVEDLTQLGMGPLREVSDADFKFLHADEDLVQSLRINKITESPRNAGYNNRYSYRSIDKENLISHQFKRNGVFFSSFNDGGGLYSVMGYDQENEYQTCSIYLRSAAMVKAE